MTLFFVMVFVLQKGKHFAKFQLPMKNCMVTVIQKERKEREK
jgi:hypothetical protein